MNKNQFFFFVFINCFGFLNCNTSKLITKSTKIDDDSKILDLALEKEYSENNNLNLKKCHSKKDIEFDCTEILNKFLNIETLNDNEDSNFENIELQTIEKKNDYPFLTVYRVICIFGSKVDFQKNVNKLYKITEENVTQKFFNRSYENGNYAMKIGFFFSETEANNLLYKLNNSKLKAKNCRIIKELISNEYSKILEILNSQFYLENSM